MIHVQQIQPQILQNIRLIATDMDGTLTKQGKFTAELLQSLATLQQKGIPVLIVTGRSAGWVNGIVSYLPVVGAIAENGGIFFTKDPQSTSDDISMTSPIGLPLESIPDHRQKLATMFQTLQAEFPAIQEATDNRFRITDWTFDVQGLSNQNLQVMSDRCQAHGWGFTYSTVQCHIKPFIQEKANALLNVLQNHFPDISPNQVITVGDSPNDESLFDGDRFPHSIGVANVLHYTEKLTHKPAYVTQSTEVVGFCEIVSLFQ